MNDDPKISARILSDNSHNQSASNSFKIIVCYTFIICSSKWINWMKSALPYQQNVIYWWKQVYPSISQFSLTNLNKKKPHTFIIIYQGMEENFINSGIVKKRVYNRLTNLLVESYTLWPPSSQDISPSDFMLWSHLRKRLVYSNPSWIPFSPLLIW